jgi:hypothetical protein
MNDRLPTQHSQFDLAQASQRLRAETDLLCAVEARGGLSQRTPAASVALEAWLIDRAGRPARQNGAFIASLNSPAVAAGSAQFRIVLRTGSHAVAGDGITNLMRDLQTVWVRCQETAQSMGLRMLAIGVLPTIDDADLAAASLSANTRQPLTHAVIRIDIESARERLLSEHLGIVPAAAVTSLHAHLQVAPEVAARFNNASIIAAFATVGLAANAPYLFGADLWEDTRIALLEQIHGASPADADRAAARIQFIGSPEDYFRANLAYPTQVIAAPEAPQRFAQLRCHNDALWRWSRLQIGFGEDGAPHLRIEQHAMSPGPTPADIIANLCFYYGLTASLATEPDPPELRIGADIAHTNLLAVARGGLNSEVAWLDKERMPLRSLLIVELIERAHDGLHQLGVDDDVAQRHLSLIERRVAGNQTGAVWQRRFVHAHGRNFALLAREYAARQLGGAPVHEWNVRRLT